MQDFIAVGRDKLGDVIFERIYTQIAYQVFDCQLILAGFDEQQIGRILSVKNPGTVDRHAIGTTLYQTNEAKIFSSLSPNAGWDTEIIILRVDQEPRSLNQREMGKLNEIWNKEGRPRQPKRLDSRLKGMSRPVGSVADTSTIVRLDLDASAM